MTLTLLDELLLFPGTTLLVALFIGRGLAAGWMVTILYGVQLLGLLKHDLPVVYEEGAALPSRHTPRVATTRGLDGFEKEALARLRQGESLVVARSADELRGIGALQADGPCLACHDVESGALLGALSYALKAPDVPL